MCIPWLEYIYHSRLHSSANTMQMHHVFINMKTSILFWVFSVIRTRCIWRHPHSDTKHIELSYVSFYVWNDNSRIPTGQQKSENFDLGQGILKFTNKSAKSEERWTCYQYEGLIPHVDHQCHDVAAQSPTRTARKSRNVFLYYADIL